MLPLCIFKQKSMRCNLDVECDFKKRKDEASLCLQGFGLEQPERWGRQRTEELWGRLGMQFGLSLTCLSRGGFNLLL